MALQRKALSGIDTGWLHWIDEALQLVAILEPVLETLVDIRNHSFWLRLPFLRRLRPPAQVVDALNLVRALKDKLQ